MSKYLEVDKWDETNLTAIPSHETDEYEYKSSKIELNKNYRNDLKEKIQHAASAFWNSGGGYFIVGVADKTGQVDGGISDKMGRQNLRDWIDQIIVEVEPVGQYKVHLIQPSSTMSPIASGKIVLVIGFAESYNLPHMAPDNKYYIRAGVHSVPARHYIVEAMRSRRGSDSPILKGLLRRHPDKPRVLELVVMGLSKAPAIKVSIDFEPVPEFIRDRNPPMPLQIPVINDIYPFRMDITTVGTKDWLGHDQIYLNLTYESLLGQKFKEVQLLDFDASVSDFEIIVSNTGDIDKSVKKLSDDLHWLRLIFQTQLLNLLMNFLTEKANSQKPNESDKNIE